MILLRFILISIIIYLLIRSFARFLQGEEPRSDNHARNNHNSDERKKSGVPRELGEYVDYEEIKD